MAWYRAGTVSVTNGSTTVMGTGTAWVANVNVGEEFRLLGGSVGFEIVAVVSDTQLTLATAYTGTTQGGQAYQIVPVRGILATAAAAFFDLKSQVEGFLGTALAGRFGNGTNAEPGMSFVSDPNTGFTRPGADQIGFVTGGAQRGVLSTTALNLSVPVTGAAVVANTTDVTAGRLLTTGAGPAQAFRRGNILGAVSQSAGVPTGAIIERGNNANGEFVRFADGTQICTRANLDIPFLGPSVCQVDWVYPAAFAGSSPFALSGAVQGNVTFSNAAPGLDMLLPLTWSNSGANATTARLSIYRVAGSTNFVSGNFVRMLAVMAVGRWF